MDLNKERQQLHAISRSHRYTEGFNGRLSKYRALTIRELYSQGGALLDLGAGEGVLAAQLAGQFDTITITEASSEYLDQAKKNLSGYPVTFLHALIEEVAIHRQFDLVLASGILEHVHSPRDTLIRIKRWLAPGGMLIVIVPNASSLHRQVGVYLGMIKDYHELGELDHKVGHRRYYGLNDLQNEVVSAGYSISSSGGILLKPFPNSLMDGLTDAYCDALYHLGKDHPSICAEIYCACRIN